MMAISASDALSLLIIVHEQEVEELSSMATSPAATAKSMRVFCSAEWQRPAKKRQWNQRRRHFAGGQCALMEASEATEGGGRGQTVTSATAVAANLPDLVHPRYLKMDVELPYLSVEEVERMGKSFDLIIVGCGPAGLAAAARASTYGLDVVVIDPEPLLHWPNNYGVWIDEFEKIGLEDNIDFEWQRADVFLGDGPGDRKTLSRPYGRVDRAKLKRSFLSVCLENGVQFLKAKARGSDKGDEDTVVKCTTMDGRELDLSARAVMDATGHVRALVKYEGLYNPGYQAAYGVLAEVDSYPLDPQAMLFMDWRDSHLRHRPVVKERNDRFPTFLYAMPFSSTHIFLEETQLVGRPKLEFDDLKERFDARMEHMGIKIKGVLEEEYCLIPMGGCLPVLPQRVMGLGGTAGMVHPSTGYMIARTLTEAPTVIDRLATRILPSKTSTLVPDAESGSSSGSSSEDPKAAAYSSDDLAAMVWSEIWSPWRLRQREFFNFGMEVLLTLNLKQTKEFFAAFFDLPAYYWQGFLSVKLTFTELIAFGLLLFQNASNQSRLDIASKGLPTLPGLIFRAMGLYAKELQNPKSPK